MINRVRGLSASKLAATIQKRIAKREHEEFLQKKLPESDKSHKMESMLAGAFLRLVLNNSKSTTFVLILETTPIHLTHISDIWTKLKKATK